jgi:hypothetical protein
LPALRAGRGYQASNQETRNDGSSICRVRGGVKAPIVGYKQEALFSDGFDPVAMNLIWPSLMARIFRPCA